MRVGLRLAAALAVALIALAALASGRALASHVECGQVITEDTRLDGDLLDCPGNGVVIGQGSLTLDLGGHTIDGTGSQGFGIDNGDGHDDVRIVNGHVREFFWGVNIGGRFQPEVGFLGATDNVVRRLSAQSAVLSIRISHSQGVRVEQNTLSTGIELSVSDSNFISDNSVGLSGMSVAGNDNVIDRNIFQDTRVLVMGERNVIRNNSASSAPFGHGFAVLGDANSLERNASFGNSLGGFGVRGDGNRLSRNIAFDNRSTNAGTPGIGVFGNNNLIDGNASLDNAGGGFGIQGDGNVVERARAVNNRGHGIVMEAGGGAVVKSRALGNLFAGIRVSGGEYLVRGNLANGNGFDGIQVVHPGSLVARNTANNNRQLGIDAVPGVVDGGGNRARGNGNPAQCVNVACR